jgi:Tfp pilus assembly protein FimT
MDMNMKRHALGGSRNAGFSIIESLLVLVGAGMLAAYSVPRLTDLANDYNTVFAAQQVCTHLHFAKMKAISSNESIRVNFPNNNSYRVELSDGTVIRGPYNMPHGIALNNVDGGAAVTFPGNNATFQADGSVAAVGRVKLISPNGLRVDVLVDPGGMIRKTPTYKHAPAPF